MSELSMPSGRPGASWARRAGLVVAGLVVLGLAIAELRAVARGAGWPPPAAAQPGVLSERGATSDVGVAPERASAARPRAAATGAPGQALSGLGASELERFTRGRAAFEEARRVETGLGPLFNEVGCNRCHNKKGVGGAGLQSAVLAGRLEGGVFDPLRREGGPSLANATLTLEADASRLVPRCKLPSDGEPRPSDANVVTRRRTTPLFGLGLVDATPEATFTELARQQAAPIRGRVARVRSLATGQLEAGKFGWKAQAPSLHEFAGLALLMELGVTSPHFPSEQPPLGDPGQLVDCDTVTDPEDDGTAVARMTDFMRLLAPIAPLEPDAEARAGSALFDRVGCADCHVRTLTSGPSPIAALSEKTYAPFSDFLLHDMGSLGDGIAEGDAGPREMRTAPLWGARLAGTTRLLHDGRARSFEDAIARHDGQGAAARAAFEALSDRERLRLVAFLSTL
jgi:CxxC motif-containing protein (DUF1111 family)